MFPLLDVNMALAKGDFNLLRNLVESGTDVNIQGKEGRTALINCCLHDGEKWALGSARLLLTHGAKVGLCDKVGRNALMYAIMYGREDLVKLFLDALDYDLEQTDKWHHTAQWYAAHCGNTNITTMVKEVSKKYCSDTKVSGKNLNFNTPIQYRTLQQQQHKPNTRDYTKNRFNNKPCTANINRAPYLLPFKPLPANLWEKRAKFYSKKQNLPCDSIQRSINYLPALQRITKPSTIPKKDGIQESLCDHTWREDIKGLTSLLEIQLTLSYQTKARLLPPSIKRYPKIPKDEVKGNLKNEAQGKRRGKNRRLSFDGLDDVLQNRSSSKGLFRRRCSVAVIPLIRFKNYKSSFSVEQEYQKFKSSFA